MDPVLDRGFTDDWYARLPGVFRDLDTVGDLLAYLRVLGDYAGGLAVAVATLEGQGFVRPIALPGPPAATVQVGVPLTVDGLVDGGTGGVRVPLEEPITTLDPDNSAILVVASGDWRLVDVTSVPREWLPWLAQAMSIPLEGVPVGYWRDWIASPVSRRAGCMESLEMATYWHVLDVAEATITRTGPWAITVSVAAESIVTSQAELEASLAALEPAGVEITLLLT